MEQKLSKKEFKQQFRPGMSCGICKHRILRLNHMNIDHIIPLSKGGEDFLGNYQFAHKWCNHLKGNKENFESPSFAWNVKCMALFELGLLKLN